MNRQALLFSGGYDSAAVWFKIKDKENTDLVFFDYGQLYMENELKKAILFAKSIDKELIVLRFPGKTDMKNRNLIFIEKAMLANYDTFYLGCRNILPIFDKYKDSNWWTMRMFARDNGIRIVLPIVGWGKKKIINYLKDNGYGYDKFYNCYNNNTDYKTCECVNCKELKKLL